MEFNNTAVAAIYAPVPATDRKITVIKQRYAGNLSDITLPIANEIYASGSTDLIRLLDEVPAAPGENQSICSG